MKRRLTDAQSLALEELRGGEGWSPDPEALAAELRGELMGLAVDSYRAGVEGGASLYGLEATVPDPPIADPTDEFARALCEEVNSVLDRAREADQSPSKVSSSVSRVYRSWRTDQAERRVVALAESAYADGMRDVLNEAGIDSDLAASPSS